MTLATSSSSSPNNKSCIFLGDDTAKKSLYFIDQDKFGVNGLPINDSEVKSMFRRFGSFDIIFFHCTYPLAGCKEIDNIKNLHKKTISSRLIPYRHKLNTRGFYHNDWWKDLQQNDIDFLFENWAQMLNCYYQDNPKILLLPIKFHWYDRQLNLPNKAMQILSQFERVVDLSPLDNYNEDNYIDKFGNLSEQGFDLIKDNILEWLKD